MNTCSHHAEQSRMPFPQSDFCAGVVFEGPGNCITGMSACYSSCNSDIHIPLPPSTSIHAPVMYKASSLARKQAACNYVSFLQWNSRQENSRLRHLQADRLYQVEPSRASLSFLLGCHYHQELSEACIAWSTDDNSLGMALCQNLHCSLTNGRTNAVESDLVRCILNSQTSSCLPCEL